MSLSSYPSLPFLSCIFKDNIYNIGETTLETLPGTVTPPNDYQSPENSYILVTSTPVISKKSMFSDYTNNPLFQFQKLENDNIETNHNDKFTKRVRFMINGYKIYPRVRNRYNWISTCKSADSNSTNISKYRSSSSKFYKLLKMKKYRILNSTIINSNSKLRRLIFENTTRNPGDLL